MALLFHNYFQPNTMSKMNLVTEQERRFPLKLQILSAQKVRSQKSRIRSGFLILCGIACNTMFQGIESLGNSTTNQGVVQCTSHSVSLHTQSSSSHRP